ECEELDVPDPRAGIRFDHDRPRVSAHRKTLRAAAVHRPQVVLPLARRLRELMHELEVVGPELRGGALVEPGMVAPPAHDAVLERDPVGPAYAARVEVL